MVLPWSTGKCGRLFEQAQAGAQPVDAAVDGGAAGGVDLDQAGQAGFDLFRTGLATPGDAADQIDGLHQAGEGDHAILVGLGHGSGGFKVAGEAQSPAAPITPPPRQTSST